MVSCCDVNPKWSGWLPEKPSKICILELQRADLSILIFLENSNTLTWSNEVSLPQCWDYKGAPKYKVHLCTFTPKMKSPHMLMSIKNYRAQNWHHQVWYTQVNHKVILKCWTCSEINKRKTDQRWYWYSILFTWQSTGRWVFFLCVCVCVCALLSKHRKHCSWNIMVEADEVLPPAPILIWWDCANESTVEVEIKAVIFFATCANAASFNITLCYQLCNHCSRLVSVENHVFVLFM